MLNIYYLSDVKLLQILKEFLFSETANHVWFKIFALYVVGLIINIFFILWSRMYKELRQYSYMIKNGMVNSFSSQDESDWKILHDLSERHFWYFNLK